MESVYGGVSVNNMGILSNCNQQLYEDVFSFPSQLPPIDFSGICGWDLQGDQFGMQESGLLDVVPLEEMLINDPFYTSLELAQNHNSLVPEVLYWDETKTGDVSKQENQNELGLLDDNNKMSGNKWALVDEELMRVEKEKKVGNNNKRGRVENVDEMNNSEATSSKKLTRERISQYYYMPITQAAREMKVGLTLLKKRCRELGIRRWPHRKLISLQTLINNVQEFGKEGTSGEGKVKEYVQILEQEKKLLEEIPDMQLEETTKRLRQAFFKANYKKRKLMGMVNYSSSSSSNTKSDEAYDPASAGRVDDEEDEEINKYFMYDCFSNCN